LLFAEVILNQDSPGDDHGPGDFIGQDSLLK